MAFKIKIISPGKWKSNDYRNIFTEFSSKTPWQLTIDEFEPRGKSKDPEYLITEEENFIKNSLGKNYLPILLDKDGKNYTSEEFSKFICNFEDNAIDIAFVIGGAYGIAPTLRNQIQHKISFGRFTWPHLLVRVMLAEQIYRAYTIKTNHPYHK